jgi:thiamine biosynthesis lipoprotein
MDSVFCYLKKDDEYFKPVFEKSMEIYQLTDGYFDPSIAPLVNYYGFGYEKKNPIEKSDTLMVSKLLSLLVFDKVVMNENTDQICLTKPQPEVALDFSALAKGYGVDILAEFINDQGVRNYMIEIGGEIRTLGVNDKGSPWIIGINRPDEASPLTAVEVPLKVSNKAMATSGNYRNSYESRGQKFAHIIHPKTGMSQETDILSVTVLAEDCMTADALATAFMVMGLEKSLELAGNLKNIDAFFIFDLEGDGQFEYRSTDHFSRYFLDNEQK